MSAGAEAVEESIPDRLRNILVSSGFLTGLVVIGVVLRSWAYLARAPLWLDEVLLSRNILELSIGQLLTEPLRVDQVAPRGFLLVEKLLVMGLGPDEWVLRLLPFIGGIVGLVLFRRLASRTLAGLAVPFALGLFAIAVPFLVFGAEVKQYELDATAAILLTLLAIDLIDHDRSLRHMAMVGAAGLLVIWFSQAAVLVMAGIGVGVLGLWLSNRDRRLGRILLVTMPAWGVAALVAVVVGRWSMSPSTAAFMAEFWASGFLPLPFNPGKALGWLVGQAQSAFSDLTMLRYAWPPLYLLLAAIGIGALWHRRRPVAWLLAGPLLIALLAAAAHQYPFRGRLMLYLIPGLLLTIAAGADWAAQALSRWQPLAGLALLGGLTVPPVMATVTATPPYDIEHLPTLLSYLQDHRQPGDVVYIAPLQRIGTLYYGPRYGLTPDLWITGICNPRDSRAYLRDLDRFRGTGRFWIISAGPRPFRRVRLAMLNYLATIGVRRDSLSLPSLTWASASLDLFDLSDSARAHSASAETFALDPLPTDPPPGCRPWVVPSEADLPFNRAAR